MIDLKDIFKDTRNNVEYTAGITPKGIDMTTEAIRKEIKKTRGRVLKMRFIRVLWQFSKDHNSGEGSRGWRLHKNCEAWLIKFGPGIIKINLTKIEDILKFAWDNPGAVVSGARRSYLYRLLLKRYLSKM